MQSFAHHMLRAEALEALGHRRSAEREFAAAASLAAIDAPHVAAAHTHNAAWLCSLSAAVARTARVSA